MKTFTLLLCLVVLHVHCLAQSGWTNFNKDNSPLLDNRVSSLALDHHNNVWGAYAGAGGSGNGIFKFDGNNWTHYNTSNSGLPNNDIRDIAVDAQGNIWFANYNAGIVKFNGSTWTRYYTTNSNIGGNDVVDIEFDSNGNLWVGCYFSGVSKFDGVSWTSYTKNNAPFPDSNCINDLTIDKSNNVWVGMDCAGGMAKLSANSGTWTHYSTSNSSIPDHTVMSLKADYSGVIYASHINVNVSTFDGLTWTAYNEPSLIDNFSLDGQGNVWGYGFGLFKFQNGQWSKTSIPEAADTTYALGLGIGSVNNFWLSTYSGLWINNANTPPVFAVNEITVDEDFEPFKVQITPASVPDAEKSQTVTYSLINNDQQKITAAINTTTGEITLSSIPDVFGTATLKIIANDGQIINSIHEVLVTVTINPVEEPNTPPVFEVAEIIVDEDFEPFKVQITPAPVPEAEKSQTVTYSLINNDQQKITAEINSTSGEITLTSIPDAFGSASLKIIANDNQSKNNIYEVLMTITINPVEDVVTGIEGREGDAGQADEVQFFPNPASHMLSCIVASKADWSGVVLIYDMMGHEVRRSVITTENPDTNVSDLSAGIYIVKLVRHGRVSKSYKIMKGG